MQDEQVFLKKYVRDNDPQAFEELARRYSGFVYGVCLRVTGNEHDAEDATQECFLELAKKPESVTGSFVGWLHLRALSRARDVVKRRGRRQRREQSAASHEVLDAEPSWDEIAPALDAAVAELPDELRMPLVLHYFHGRKQREVATELGLDHSTISRRLSKGVERLRIRLRHAGVAVSVAALATLLTNHAASAAVPVALAASLGKMAVAGVGSASAGVTASATVTAGSAGGTVTGGLGMMKLAFVGLTTAAVVTAGVVGFQSETQQTIELAVAPPPVVSEPPAPTKESNTIFDEIHSNAIPIRPRPQVDVETRIIIMKKTAAEELGVSDFTDIEILNAEKGRELIRNVRERTDATTISAPHTLTLCGQQNASDLVRTGSYISGYEKTEARPEDNSEYDYYWVPVLSSYELAHTSLTVKTEVDKNRVAFLQLVVQCDKSTLVQCEGKISTPENNTSVLVNIDEVVKDTLLPELDEKALAEVRLKYGEMLLIPAKFSRTKPTDIPEPFNPDDYKRGEDPPPMLGDDEMAFVLVTPTLLLQEEVNQNGEPGANRRLVTAAWTENRGVGADQRVFYQYDAPVLFLLPGTEDNQRNTEVFLHTLAQLTGPESWSTVVTYDPATIEKISASNNNPQKGVLVCWQGGYLTVNHIPQIQDAVAKILKELRTTAVEPFQRPSNSCAIVGQVMSAETGLPVGQATVFVFYPKTYEGFFLETNEDGRFNFDRIPTGEYLLMAVAEGYGAFPTYHGAADGDALIPIELADDAPRKEMLFKLPPPNDAANNE